MTDELRLERVIDAPREVVFDAFTTDGGQVAFYGHDDPGWIVESRCDLRVGGVWTVTFGPVARPPVPAPARLRGHRPPAAARARHDRAPPGRPSFDFATEFTFEAQDGRTLHDDHPVRLPDPRASRRARARSAERVRPLERAIRARK